MSEEVEKPGQFEGDQEPEDAAILEDSFEDDKPEEKPEKKAEKAEDPEPEKSKAAERREAEALKREIAAEREKVEYWKRQAERQPEKPEAKPAAVADYDPEKFVERLVKDPRAALRELGFVAKGETLTREEAQALTDAALERHSGEQRETAKLYGEFPELANGNSDFFKDATEALRELTGGDEKKVGNPDMIRAAAMIARAKADAAKSSKGDRESRIRAQASPGSARGEEGAPRMSPLAREFAAKMRVSAGDAEKEFKLLKRRGA